MKLIPRFLLFVFAIIFFVFGTSSKGTSQTVEEFATTDSLKAGDLFNYSITLKKDQTYDRIIFPDSTGFNDTFELRNRQRFSISDFKDSLSYQLQFWGVASDTIPSMPVQLVSGTDTTLIYTQPVPISFKSVLQSEDEEFRPLKPIFDFAAAWWPWILGLLILIALAGAFYWFYFKQKEKPESEPAPEFKPEPFLNPLKELENNLRQLKNVTLDTEERFKEFYINLGDAIRLYFEQLYHIPALESTSREIIYELNRRAIDDRLIEQTRIVLREADMVKFAKFTPTEKQARKTYKKAEKFLSIAQTLHGSRIQQMRRQHLTRIEEQRKEFEEQNSEVNT
ncbi:MAG: hypothetical protein JXR26_04200 [Balneolaceae bacterium]|nr:hypothetical protein [Balneolaceae bacterium]